MTTPRDESVVYVGSADSSDIHAFHLSGNASLTPIQVAPIPGVVKSGGSTPIAISPDKRTLFCALRGEPLMAARFSIDPASGELAHVANAPLAESLAYLIVDATGRFLLGASYGGSRATVNPIGEDGSVGQESAIIDTPPNAHAIVLSADNRRAFVASLGGDCVLQFRFDAATGALSPNDPARISVRAGSGPRHFVFHPNGKRAFLLNELDASIDAFEYDAAAGLLSPAQRIDALPPGFTGKPWAADIKITPDGRFLYATERRSNMIAIFAVEPSTGRLVSAGHVATEAQPRGIAIDPTGRVLLAVGQTSHHMTSYAIDPATGALEARARVTAGGNPNWIEIIPAA